MVNLAHYNPKEYYVTDYGAIADGDGVGGGTDNTAAVQRAVDMANSVGGGKVVFPLFGTRMYRMDGQVNLYQNVQISGELAVTGANHPTFITRRGALIDARNMTAPVTGYKATFYENAGNTSGLRISNLTFMGPVAATAANPYWFSGISAIHWGSNVAHCVLENVGVYGYNIGIRIIGGSDLKFDKVYVMAPHVVSMFLWNINFMSIKGGALQNSVSGNLYLTSDQDLGGSSYSNHIIIDTEVEDEGGGYSVLLSHTRDASVRIPTIYRSTSGGVYLNDAHRVRLHDSYVRPFGVPGAGVDINIAATSRSCALSNVSTYAAITDLSPDTSYDNCIFGGTYYNRLSTGSVGSCLTDSRATATLDVSTGSVITLNVPTGSILTGASLNNETAITFGGGGATYAAAYSGGSTQAIGTGIAAAKNTKTNALYDTNADSPVASAPVNITITPDAGAFATGTVRAVVHYREIASMLSVP